MNNQTYEDYIRSILGYDNYNTSGYTFNNQYDYQYNNAYQQNYDNNRMNEELEECYPEIYKIVYPMVRKACSGINQTINRDLVEMMTDEIYSAVEAREEVQVNISLTNSTGQNNRASNNMNTKNLNSEKQTEVKISQTENREDRVENRRRRPNNNIRDIIKILILRELLGRPGLGNTRPPRPPHRPIFPGRPGRPGGPNNNMRPPMMPRFYEDIYEV